MRDRRQDEALASFFVESWHDVFNMLLEAVTPHTISVVWFCLCPVNDAERTISFEDIPRRDIKMDDSDKLVNLHELIQQFSPASTHIYISQTVSEKR